MSGTTRHGRVLTTPNVREFFRESVGEALERHRVRADDHTVYYVVNLLTLYTRADEFYGEEAAPGRGLPPLARMFADAGEADSDLDRDRHLQRLGDVALFMAGFFPDYFERRPVGVDYCIRMGGAAYGTLAERSKSLSRTQALAEIFAELAAKFAEFVDVLGEIADLGRRYTSRDILRCRRPSPARSPRVTRRSRGRGAAPAGRHRADLRPGQPSPGDGLSGDQPGLRSRPRPRSRWR